MDRIAKTYNDNWSRGEEISSSNFEGLLASNVCSFHPYGNGIQPGRQTCLGQKETTALQLPRHEIGGCTLTYINCTAEIAETRVFQAYF